MSRRSRRELDAVTFDFAPMVDVVLLLVIFFMLASNLVSQDRALPLDLPSASKTQRTPPRLPTVSIDKAGEVYLATEKQQDLATLEAKLKPLTQASGGLVRFRADRAVSYGRVISVMDAIKKAGGQRLAAATQGDTPPSSAPTPTGGSIGGTTP
jgi:biopolymer transport protein ExbD